VTEDESIPLRDYVNGRFEAQEKAVAAALAAQEKAVAAALTAADRAVLKAETATEKRFENSNEWRATVETLQRTYMPRTEFEQVMKGQTEKIDALTTRINARDDRGKGMGEVVSTIISVVALAAALVAIFRVHP
jgi:hypothetical protein